MYGESVMREITTLGDLKGRLQAGFENDEESLGEFGKTYSTQLKAYLIESNQRLAGAGCPMLKPYQASMTLRFTHEHENPKPTFAVITHVCPYGRPICTSIFGVRQSTNVAKQTIVKCGCVRKRYE